MLEKIGLPAKPSLKGNTWVVDASHCQGCSSQFTFINRKHHCRRCGGLFCGSCTQQRMILRGQGDSSVRICDPCKKLEEAERFQKRHGHKNRTSRGGSKLTAKYEDEMLNQILGTDKQSSLSGNEATTSNALSDFQKGTSKGSSSNFNEVILPVDAESASTEDIASCNPEELLQQSLEEKKKYRILKGEGKPEEALKAFKRGKELERQAKALEVELRKNNRKASSSNSLSGKKDEDLEGFLTKNKLPSHIDKEEKKDLASELRELGWSDADLHDADKKPVKTSLEGELSALLGEVHKKSNSGKGAGSIDKTQVIALKRKALVFKREGKLAEAKEELKKAKVLEKQLEEQEFLAGAEDSDDELSSLIRSMDGDKQDDFSLPDKQDDVFDFNSLVGVSDDLGLDGNFEVTEQDLEDPDIAAALESLGWTEDSEQFVPEAHSAPVDGKALLDEVLALKKEAVRQKRSGNTEEAMALLRKAKLLEKDAESLQPRGNNMTPNPTTEQVLTSQIGRTSRNVEPKLQPKSKLTIQRELLGLKKRALVLKREGRLDEAEEELRKGKVLESQLEEMENGSRVRPPTVGTSRISESLRKQPGISEIVGLEEEDEVKVTEQDMQDPSMLEMLESLGWKDEDMRPGNVPSRQLDSLDSHPGSDMDPLVTEIAVRAPKRSKAEIQRELLSLKRKALTLRRQGETEEADEVLIKAKLLETQMEEIEVSKKGTLSNTVTNTPEAVGSIYSLQESQSAQPFLQSSVENVAQQGIHDSVRTRLDGFGFVNEQTKSSEQSVKSSEHVRDPSNIHAPTETPNVERRSKAEIQRELLALKRKALKLRRQGETEEAEEVLEMAKVLEAKIEEMTAPKNELLLDSTKYKEPDVGFSVSKEKSGDVIAAEEVRKGISDSLAGSENARDLATASPWNNSSINMPPSRPFISTPTVSQVFENETPLLDLDPPAEIKVVEHAGFFPQSGQSVNNLDLLSGDVWQSSQMPTGEVESKGSFSSNLLFSDNSYAQSETSKTSNKVMTSKDEYVSKNVEKSASSVGKAPRDEMDSTPPLNSQNNPSDLREKVLARKRKAVVLKREGKLAEAREELRQAKLLEKSLQEDKPQPDAGSTTAFVSASNDSLLVQEERKTTQQAPPLTGRDRFKLQQESLAHKRKALKLRREGRMAEAEAEFELAKELETQLEESSGHEKSNNETEKTDDLGVEDLLDPQLLSALKAIGIQGAEIATQAPARPESSKPNSSKNDTSSQERSQLEERIKAEKIKAVNLKKAGKQAEALDALRRAKMYEKKINTLG